MKFACLFLRQASPGPVFSNRVGESVCLCVTTFPMLEENEEKEFSTIMQSLQYEIGTFYLRICILGQNI